LVCQLLSLSFTFLAISVNLVDHSSQDSTNTCVSRGYLSENLVKVLEIPFLLLFILAIGEFLRRLSLLFTIRSITTSTSQLGTTLSRWSPRGTLGGGCTGLATLNRGRSLSLFSGKLSGLSLFLDLACFFFPFSALLLFLNFEKSGVVIRVGPQRLGRSEGFSHDSVFLQVS
jgi:hypothetical protein